jgi:hypothetical protein
LASAVTRDQQVRLAMATLRRRHWAYVLGSRSPKVVASERVYQSVQRRIRHTQPS